MQYRRVYIPGGSYFFTSSHYWWILDGTPEDVFDEVFLGSFLNLLLLLAGGPGFEPGLTESESVVLPLDDPPVAGCLMTVCRRMAVRSKRILT
jgi:hypothetical protein